MDRVRLLLADDHPMFLEGLRCLLASAPDLEVVGEAGTGEQAVKYATSLSPDVIIMDLHMPDGDGVEATRHIASSLPQAKVLVLTMFEDDEWVFTAMQAGARGYLLKDAERADILHAIRAVASGDVLFGSGIAQRVISYFSTAVGSGLIHPFPELTGREREVLDLMAGGLKNTDIAQRLSLQPKTVRNRISSIFAKLQVADRAQAIVRAREAGLGRGHPGSPRSS
ncbi:response regulator transcription factor [Streptomyces sp. NPDC000151]|uniref:response regulator transcription factor n=1 Tax=Streptomyces sp. NPDC000151 TaxID=3154244 RepID=UPI00332BC780